MTVLFCHNYYRYRGGEDESFEDEVAMLREAGIQVVPFVRSNDDLGGGLAGGLRTAREAIYSRSSRREVEALLREHRPDVVHCNNLFPQISGSVFDAAAAAGVPVVQALRNYRYLCAAGSLYRDGGVCLDCLGRSASLPGVVHGCYRGSRAASAAVVAVQLGRRLRDRAARAETLFFTPTAFARSVFLSAGFAPDRVAVKPNFVHPDLGPGPGDAERMLYVGRLTEEKGLWTLLAAWDDLDVPLDIYGDGPLAEVVAAAAARHPSIRFHGHVAHGEVLRAMGEARALVMPSEWFETFGRTLVEAFSRGTPAIASDLGAMAEIVEDGRTGRLVPPGDPDALAFAVREMIAADPPDTIRMREKARRAFETRYARDVNLEALLKLYARAGVPRERLPTPTAA